MYPVRHSLGGAELKQKETRFAFPVIPSPQTGFASGRPFPRAGRTNTAGYRSHSH